MEIIHVSKIDFLLFKVNPNFTVYCSLHLRLAMYHVTWHNFKVKCNYTLLLFTCMSLYFFAEKMYIHGVLCFVWSSIGLLSSFVASFTFIMIYVRYSIKIR